ncbi:SDR family NAD(P)-dependent oxidoreductase [Belliella baltica]
MKSLFIITGASKGIGRALVDQLSENTEHQIIGISRSSIYEEKSNIQHLSLDLGDFDAIINSLSQIFPEGNFERIVLINNAGWIGQIDYFGKIDAKSIQKIHNINTIAPALLMNGFVRKYRDTKNSERTVINISSGAAKKGIDGWSGYSSSKAALNMMTEAAQEEANKSNSKIKFFALSPGVVDTKMQEDIRSAPEDGFSLLGKFKGLKADNALSSPEEAAEKIIFLIENRDQFEGVLQDVREF